MNKAYYQKDRILIPTIDAQYTYGYGSSLSGPKVSATLGLIIEKFN